MSLYSIKKRTNQSVRKNKTIQNMAFSDGSDSKEPACNEGALGWEDPLEEGTATHSSILAWRIPWTAELGRLQSTGSQRVRHN